MMINTHLKKLQEHLYTKVHLFKEDDIVGSKATRAETIYTTTVTHNDKVYDADEQSMNRMARYLHVASYEFTSAISSGATAADAFSSAYTNVTIEWKLADNSTAVISVEDLAEIYKLAVANMKEIWLS
jgi:hypothetical protein